VEEIDEEDRLDGEEDGLDREDNELEIEAEFIGYGCNIPYSSS
jgi:hypothetical protein